MYRIQETETVPRALPKLKGGPGHYNEKAVSNMHSSRLSMPGRLTLTLLAVLMLSTMITATAAQAEITTPLKWKVEGTELRGSETREATGTRWSANPSSPEPLVMEADGIKIECEEGKPGRSAFITNEGGQATSVSSPEFAKCKVVGNGEPCKVEEPIKSKPIRSEAVLSDNEPGQGKKVLVESEPLAGTEAEMAELKFEGTNCKFANTIIGKGLGIESVYTDPLATGGTKPEPIELGVNATTESSSFLVKDPDEPKSVYLWKEPWTLFEPRYLKAFSSPAKMSGTGLLMLAENGKPSGKKFGLVE
jgi:hypothetical protein